MASSLEDIQSLPTPFVGETLAIPKPKEEKSLDDMDVDELLELRQQIEDRLPAKRLSDMDLEQELVLQYQAVKALQARVNEAEDIPANQLAQVANTISSSLDKLTKMQAGLYSHERFKQLEYILIRQLKAWPTEQVEQFFKEYEELTKDL